MRNIIGSAMVGIMALSLCTAAAFLGGVGSDLAERRADLAAPAFFLGYLAAVLWALKVLTARAVSWKQAPTHWPVLAFLLYAAVRYFTSPVEYDSRMELLQIGFYALVYFVAANNFYHSRDRTVLIAVIGVLVVLEAGYAMWQVAYHSEKVFWLTRPVLSDLDQTPQYAGRGSGSFICPNHLAGFLEMALGLLMGRAAFFHGRRGISEKDAVRKVLIIYASLMALAGIVATFSRIGGLATFVALLALLFWGEGRLRAGWQRVTVVSAIVFLILGAGLIAPKAFHRLNVGFLPEQSDRGHALLWRGQIWRSTTQIIADSPVFGTGPGTWQWFHQRHRNPDVQDFPAFAHSDVLQLFSDYGLIGWLIAVAFLVCYFWQVALLTTRKTPSEQRSFAIGGSIAVIAILAHSWGDFNMHVPANALLFVTIIGFTAAIEDPKEKFPRAPLARLPRIALCLAILLLGVGGALLTGKAAASSWFSSKGTDLKEVIQWEAARGFYERAIALDPGNPEPFFNMGETYRVEGEWRIFKDKQQEREQLARRAVGLFQETLARNPYHTHAFVHMSRAYELFGDTTNALRALEQALAIDPQSAFVYHRIGLLYHRLGDEDKSTEVYKKSEELFRHVERISRLGLEENLSRE